MSLDVLDKDPKDREAHRIVESIEFVEEDPDVKLEEELPGGITMGVTKPREQRHTKVNYLFQFRSPI